MSTTIPTHWFCSECKDGPFLIANNTGCPNCYHLKCDYCQVAVIHPKYSRGDNTTCTGLSTMLMTKDISPLNSSCAPDSNTIASIASHGVVANTSHNYRGTTISAHNHAHFGGPTDGGDVVFRWRCCSCWGDNSYEYDKGCSICSNHWRCASCSVYDVKE